MEVLKTLLLAKHKIHQEVALVSEILPATYSVPSVVHHVAVGGDQRGFPPVLLLMLIRAQGLIAVRADQVTCSVRCYSDITPGSSLGWPFLQ